MFEQDNFKNAAGHFNSPSQFGTPAGDEKKQVRRQMNVVPVSISQVLEASDDGLKIGSVDVNLVNVVGLVKSVDTSSTRMQYVMQDDTGCLNASLFVDSGRGYDSANTMPVVENSYYRMIGSIRTTQGHATVLALKMLPLTELNELTTHLLEVIHTKVKAQQLLKKKEMQPVPMADGHGLQNSLMGASFDGRSGSSMSNFGAAGGPINGFTPSQQIVYNAIQNCIDGTGIHKSAIANNARGRVSPKEIENILEFLSNEGHIYSTIDDEHFKTTDSC